MKTFLELKKKFDCCIYFKIRDLKIKFRNQKRFGAKLRMASSFRSFFEGIYDYDYSGNFDSVLLEKPKVDIPIEKFGITRIQYKFTGDIITTVKITLKRPGIFIGKGGRVIDEITEYISEFNDLPVKILIKEAKDVWTHNN